MFINKILSFRNSWNTLNDNHKSELDDILQVLPEYLKICEESKDSANRFQIFRETWDNKFEEKNWDVGDRIIRLENGQKMAMRNIGPIKNEVSVKTSMFGMDILNRWLFQHTIIAYKYGLVKVPILLCPVENLSKQMESRFTFRASFEQTYRQLQPLIPLSHAYPFLILGYSNEKSKQEILELDSDSLVNTNDVLVDRCIEFPAEYHQAGLNILSFFGTYISEQYPNENAKVKIEQDGKLVRLIIESDSGRREVIEKALNEYELFVTGKKKPEEITQNQVLILEMRNELRMAKFRIESQQDIISIQNRNIDQLDNNVNRLMSLIGDSLNNKASVNIDFKPTINLSNSSVITLELSGILIGLDELRQMVPESSTEFLQLSDLKNAVVALEKEKDPDVVKNSSAMTKLYHLIDSISDKGTKLSKILKATETGWDTFRSLAGKYNSIAEWCGLPQVPKIFTK